MIELHAAFLDDNPVAALEFLRGHTAPQIPRKDIAACDSSRVNPLTLPGRAGQRGHADRAGQPRELDVADALLPSGFVTASGGLSSPAVPSAGSWWAAVLRTP